ncbi:hypothetical protein DXT98_01430 [Agrobacterium sp. ICMP 7243]|nr:hypothetical protein DXT98_01430 [Agrobacterium sp. ICMP 7243]
MPGGKVYKTFLPISDQPVTKKGYRMSLPIGLGTSFDVKDALDLVALAGEIMKENSSLLLVISVLIAVPVLWRTARHFIKIVRIISTIVRIISTAVEAALTWLDRLLRALWNLVALESQFAFWTWVATTGSKAEATARLKLLDLEKETE